MNAAIDNATPDADAKLVAMARAEMYAGLSRLLASPEQAIATAWVDHVMIIERLLMADEALSVDGNPEFSTIMKVISALGLKLHASTST